MPGVQAVGITPSSGRDPVAILENAAPRTTIDQVRIATYGNSVARKKISTTVYITPEQNAALKQLHERTRVPVAEYIRQGIDMVLDKYKEHLPGQVDLFGE